MTVLAADIGGTNSRLAIYEQGEDGLAQIAHQTYPSEEYSCVADIISLFLTSSRKHCDAACLGLPGPVGQGQVIQLTNLPWQVDREQLRKTIHTDQVELINDVQASAAGVYGHPVTDFECLHDGHTDPTGNRAVISLGTGLGVAGLTPSGRAFATEAGHATFSPREDLDFDLLRDLSREYDHVSWERVASGPALQRIYSLLAPADAPQLDTPAIVEGAGSDPLCRRTVDVFSRYVGVAAGNIALTMMGTGGVFFCGGVAPKIFDANGAGTMLEAFVDKGRMRPLLERVPIYLVRDEDLALDGAARTALRHTAMPEA
jgi:glucokinase